MNRISIVGGGIWGTVMAHRLSKKGLSAVIWAREKEAVTGINENHENSLFARGLPLHAQLRAVESLEDLSGSDLYINAVPVQFIRDVWSRMNLKEGSPLVNLSKGIENRTGEFPADILRDLAGTANPVYTLSGPSFAREVYEEKHTAVVLAGDENPKTQDLQALLSDETFRVYRNDDLIGVEIAGALKNVIAIGAGIIDGIKAGMNSRAAVITRGVAETMRLGLAMGAKESTFLGLAGFGDFILTCTHAMSRNFSFGRLLARTGSVNQALNQAGGVVEGYFTLKSAVELGRRYNVELPIMDGLYAIIYDGRRIGEVITALMSRDLKPEWGGYSDDGKESMKRGEDDEKTH